MCAQFAAGCTGDSAPSVAADRSIATTPIGFAASGRRNVSSTMLSSRLPCQRQELKPSRPHNGFTFSRKQREQTLANSLYHGARFGGCNLVLGGCEMSIESLVERPCQKHTVTIFNCMHRRSAKPKGRS